MEKRFVYADNAATTPVSKAVLDKMLPFFSENYGNASTLYKHGQASKAAMDMARAQVAAVINAGSEEIFFTGSGTEADNMALRGMIRSKQARGRKHIITTAFEHHAVLYTAQALEKEGCRVTYLPLDSTGLINLDELKNAICEDTLLVSIMAANNEVGTVLPLAEIGKICREKGVYFHTDAVQAFGHIPLDVEGMNIDLLSLSAHKICGPKGTGAIYIRRGILPDPVITGGGQERNRRSGTENVPGIVGLGEAARIKCENMAQESAHVKGMSRRLIDGVLSLIPQVILTGHPQNRLPSVNSFAISAIEGESLIMLLDMDGICASTGSACSTGSLDPSHVLMSIGLKHDVAHGSLRLSLSENNTMEDVEYILEKLPPIVQRLRAMSPVWKE